MNARLYEAALGRFLSPDPYVQMPDFSQSFNRYSYCVNNPLLYFDLTGYAWYNDFWNWLKENSEIMVPIVTITVAAIVTVATAGAGSPLLVAAIGGAAGGFAGGALGAALDGKKFGEVIGNAFLQAGIGALSGFVGGAAGQWAAKGGLSLISSAGAEIASPVIKGAVTGALGGAAGGLAGGFTAGFTMSMIATKGDFAASLQAGWEAGLNSAITGAGIGLGAGTFTGYKYAKANNLDLWSGKSNVSNSLRQVGSVLESVDDVFANPELLRGKTPLEVEGILSDTPGWKVETLGKGGHQGQGMILREYGSNGTTGRLIQWHPGGGHHGANPYWKVSSDKGTFRIFF